jgi:branched-chain amino acid transport system ATP-binding protein
VTALVTALAATQLSCGHQGRTVVTDLSLTVTAGEVALLIGANGSGKTTTLMTLAGAIAPLSGEVLLHGRPCSAPMHRRVRSGMAFVPEGRGVFSQLTVRDNLRLGVGPVGRALELFPELEPLRGRRAGTLSGGEQQMVRLARALAGRPSILLIDELSLGLAPRLVRRLFGAVRAAADGGTAVLIVEQHVRLALTFADSGYVLGAGDRVRRETGSELRRRLPEIESASMSPIPSTAGEPR